VPVYAKEIHIDKVSNQKGEEITSQTKVEPCDTLTFEASFGVPWNVSESNKNFWLEVVKGEDWVEKIECDSVRFAKNRGAQDKEIVIRAVTNQNGSLLFAEYALSLYVPVESIVLDQVAQRVDENTTYLLSSLIYSEIYPSNASVTTVGYDVVEGMDFARIEGDRINIGTVPNKDGFFVLQASVMGGASGGLLSQSIVIKPYLAAQWIDLSADNLYPLSSMLGGEIVTLRAQTDDRATENNPILTVIKGAELLAGNVSNGTVLGDSITVKPGLTTLSNIDLHIVIQAQQDGVATLLDIYPEIAVDTLVLSAQQVQRGKANALQVVFNNGATNKGWRFLSASVGGVKVSDIDIQSNGESGILFVDRHYSAGTEILVIYRSDDKQGKEFEATFVVDKLDDGYFENSTNHRIKYGYGDILVDHDNSSATPDKTFSIPYKDANQGAWSYLWVGTATQVILKADSGDDLIGEEGLPTYGIASFKTRILQGSAKASGNTITVDTFAKGESEIWYQVELVDGDVNNGGAVYRLAKQGVKVYRPASGTPLILQAGIVTQQTQLSLTTAFSQWDTSSSYRDIQSFFENGQLRWMGVTVDSTVSGNITLSSGGVLTINHTSISPTVTINLALQEKFNGVNTRVYEFTITQTILKSITLDNQGGTSAVTTVAGINGVNLTKPTRADYVFAGYYSDRVWGGAYYDKDARWTGWGSYLPSTGTNQLYARWVAKTVTQVIREWGNDRVHDLPRYTQENYKEDNWASIQVDLEMAKAAGLTKLTFTISIDNKGIEFLFLYPEVKREFNLFFMNGTTGYTAKVASHTPTSSKNWQTSTFSITLVIDEMRSLYGDNARFRMVYRTYNPSILPDMHDRGWIQGASSMKVTVQ
ncbi:MAG: InlB B-repeat-containing protein, partial [Firmicutes bacterium]|nr:InlB B-repeat-containing protein [Bacillota bacterium]